MKSIILYIIIILFSFLYCVDECDNCKDCVCRTEKRYDESLDEYEDYEVCYCSKCKDGYILAFSGCHEKCRESEFLYDCKKCDSNGYSCRECQEGFEIDGNACRKQYLYCDGIKREHCEYCKDDSNECADCYYSYFLRNGTCVSWADISNYLGNKFQKYFIFFLFLFLLIK